MKILPVLALVTALAASPAAAQTNPALWGRANYFDVCNEGTESVYIAAAYTRFNLLEFESEHVVTGWLYADPGECVNTFEFFGVGIVDEGERFYLGFALAGDEANYIWPDVGPFSGSTLRTTDQVFCVRKNKFSLQGSLSKVSRCSGEYVPMQFAMRYDRPEDPYRTNMLIQLTLRITPTRADFAGTRPLFASASTGAAPQPASTPAASAPASLPPAVASAAEFLESRLNGMTCPRSETARFVNPANAISLSADGEMRYNRTNEIRDETGWRKTSEYSASWRMDDIGQVSPVRNWGCFYVELTCAGDADCLQTPRGSDSVRVYFANEEDAQGAAFLFRKLTQIF